MNRAFGAAALYPQHDRDPKRCPQGRRLKKLVKQAEKGFRSGVPTAEEVARLAFIEAGKALCVARCGGCSLTVGWRPSA